MHAPPANNTDLRITTLLENQPNARALARSLLPRFVKPLMFCALAVAQGASTRLGGELCQPGNSQKHERSNDREDRLCRSRIRSVRQTSATTAALGPALHCDAGGAHRPDRLFWSEQFTAVNAHLPAALQPIATFPPDGLAAAATLDPPFSSKFLPVQRVTADLRYSVESAGICRIRWERDQKKDQRQADAPTFAGVAELADANDSKSFDRKVISVRPRAPGLIETS